LRSVLCKPDYPKDILSIPKLSICIATYNRGSFIGETLDSILSQIEPGVELLVVDGASTDNTPEVMKHYLTHYPAISYYRELRNSGVDVDYDKAVGYAKGEFCWLMSDDDHLNPGAVQRVLSAIDGKRDLIVVNSEIWNATFSEKLLDRRLRITRDIEYGKDDRDKMFMETANQLGFIGCVVIRRSLWLSSDRASYYGTLFIHVGVIFQRSAVEAVMVIAEPFIAIRGGNATWTARTFEVWAIKWPDLIWSFSGFSDVAKQAVCPRDQWRRFKFLFGHRAMGTYSLSEFHKFLSPKVKGFARAKAYLVAAFPGKMANLMVVFYYLLFKRSSGLQLFDVLCSRYSTSATRMFARALGMKASR
jgi:abequosyltransferase